MLNKNKYADDYFLYIEHYYMAYGHIFFRIYNIVKFIDEKK